MTKLLTSLLLLVFISQIYAQKHIHFNPYELKNWYAFDAADGKHNNPLEVFQIDKKMFRFHGNKPGYIMSNTSFSNFKLEAQFRWNIDSAFIKTSKTKNSGIMYLVPDTAQDKLWCTGIQFQIKEKCTGDFVFLGGVSAEINGKQTTSGKSMVYQKFLEAEKEHGKWNKVEIISKNGEIIQKLNGKVVNVCTNPTIKTGRILFQYEGYPIDFKKISLKEL